VKISTRLDLFISPYPGLTLNVGPGLFNTISFFREEQAMNKTTFIQDQEVQAFMHWIGQNLHTLQIDLNIKSSRFVPKGIKKRCIGFHEVLNEYIWKAEGMKTGDWLESVSTLSSLIANLRHAADRGSDVDALDACKAILKWGGNRDYNKGAYPFLAEQKHLRRYLQTAAKAF
jgi:hypothetical protein